MGKTCFISYVQILVIPWKSGLKNPVRYNIKNPNLNSVDRLAKNETIVRGQDYMLCLRYIAQNPIGLPIVWEFIREEWPYLVERFSLNDRYLGRMPKYISYTFSSQLRLDELLAFFKKYPEAGAGKLILNYVRLLRLCQP